ncbi:hypothetical protein [Micromonospora sp. NPDC005367]|uniref:hypothetical protein n=1 Tax=Micromonospora sp. NPDC005367 TaxID=3155590 RepID=UPI0033BDA556
MRGTLTATGIILALLAGYALSCAVRPFRDCMVCDGKGHHRSKKNRKLSRPCRWCKSSGKRLRFGRRAWNKAREKYRAA